MSPKKILLLPTSQTKSKYGKEENGNRLFTTRGKKEESDKTDANSRFRQVMKTTSAAKRTDTSSPQR